VAVVRLGRLPLPAWLAAVCLICIWPAGVLAAPKEELSETVTSTIVVDAASADYPQMSARLELRSPASSNWVAPLSRWANDAPQYEQALRELLAERAGRPRPAWPPPKTPRPNPGFVLGSDVAAPPRPRPALDAGRAVLSVRADDRIWRRDSCRDLGLWELCGQDDEIAIASRQVPLVPGGELILEARLAGLEVVGVDPVPARREGDRLVRWRFAKPVEADQVTLWVRPVSASTRVLLASNSGAWYAFAQPAAYVGSMLMLVFALLVVLRRHDATQSDTWRPLNRACWFTVGFGALALGAWMLYTARYNDLVVADYAWAPIVAAVSTGLAVLTATATAALFVAPRRRSVRAGKRSSLRKPLRPIAVACGVFGMTALAAGTFALAGNRSLELRDYGYARVLDIGLAIAAFVLLLGTPRRADSTRGQRVVRWLVLGVLIAVVVAAWLWRGSYIGVWPFVGLSFSVVAAAIVWWMAGAWTSAGPPWRRLVGATVLVTGISVVAWELLVRRISNTVHDQGGFAAGGLGYARDRGFWPPVLAKRTDYRDYAAGDLPPDILLTAIDFVSFGVLAAAVAALYAEAHPSRSSDPPPKDVLFRTGSPAPAVLVVLFATFVAGTWSGLFALRMPLAFVVFIAALALVPRALRDATPGTRLVAALPEIRRTAALQQPDARRNGWSVIGLPDQAAPAPSDRRWTFAAKALQRGFLPEQPAAGSGGRQAAPASTPGRVALGLGPANTWWANGLDAVRIGALLAIPPAIHYLSVSIRANGGRALRENPLGAVEIFGWGLGEYAFWLVAAFVLGALLPYLPGRTGVIKGAALGALYGLTQFADHLLPGSYDVLGWLFIAASTTLYLCAVGFILDLRTLRAHGLGWAAIGPHYGTPHARDVLAYALPLFLLVGWVVQQAISGEAERAVGEFFQLAPSLVPQGR
jgi:hypothetical protein